ncbi:SHOCT domain-containing protein [Mycobacterium seoulense]|uniref:SHOCT domain-containing protein n=1 Tax=Mycobacterium seoulense TaxID=386911 RepID=UPI003CE8BB9C
MKTKVVVLLAGGMLALVLLTRYFALSRAGLPLGWMLYLGLPITAAGVLFALRLIDLGAGWTTKGGAVPHSGGSHAHPPALPPSGPPPYDRLKQLEDLHARGAISDTEYSARRLHIIADM